MHLIFQFILLGAVPFPIDVPRLKEHGVCGVITLNEPYETLVPTSLYHVIVLFLYIYNIATAYDAPRYVFLFSSCLCFCLGAFVFLS